MIGLSRETGLSEGSIEKVYGDIEPSDIRLVGDNFDKNSAEHLFNKGDGGGTGTELVKNVANLVESLFGKAKNTITNVSKTLKLVGDDVDAVADVQATLRQNKKVKNNGELAINDNDLNTAFANTVEFLEQYKGKVSGAFANRFGRANSPELDFVQARGELEAAKDILDGKTRLGNIDNIRGLREIYGQKNPEYFLEALDGSTRLIEVKTLTGNVTDRKIRINLGKAIEQIDNNKSIINPTKNGYVRLDFSNANSVTRQPDIWLKKVNNVFESNSKGFTSVEFVEVLYKNEANQVQKLLIQVKNGIVGLVL